MVEVYRVVKSPEIKEVISKVYVYTLKFSMAVFSKYKLQQGFTMTVDGIGVWLYCVNKCFLEKQTNLFLSTSTTS